METTRTVSEVLNQAIAQTHELTQLLRRGVRQPSHPRSLLRSEARQPQCIDRIGLRSLEILLSKSPATQRVDQRTRQAPSRQSGEQVLPVVPRRLERNQRVSRIPAGPILAGHLQDQLLDLGGCPRATDRAALAAIVLLRDKPAIPSEQGVWRYQSADLKEPLAADRLSLRCKAAALTICKRQTLPTQLLAEYPVLLQQVLDYVLLTAIHPSGKKSKSETGAAECS